MEEADIKLSKKEKRELGREERRKEQESSEKTSQVRKIVVWIVILGVLGWLGFRAYKFLTTPTPGIARVPIEIVATDRVRGDSEAKVMLLEYGDYQCPACAEYNPLVDRLLEDFPKDVKLVYRHFPLVQIHKNALAAAKAAEAAGKQDKFWEMHKLLYDKQDSWSEIGNAKDKFAEYAGELGLDVTKFTSDFESEEVDNKIKADIASGNAIGINSTPTFFLNGEKVAPRSYEEFKKLVEGQLQGYTTE